jgi:hypothetical protein
MKRKHSLQLTVWTALCSISTTAVAQATDHGALPGAAPADVMLTSKAVTGDSVRPPGVDAGPMLVAQCLATVRMTECTGGPENAANFGCR